MIWKKCKALLRRGRGDTLKKTTGALLLTVLLCAACSTASAVQMDAQSVQAWLVQLAQMLQTQPVLNNPMETVDPARGGQALFSYDFGTVLASAADTPDAGEITEIDVRTDALTDCLGLRVGMTLSDALDGAVIDGSQTQLCVLSLREEGPCWSWAYTGEDGVYGVEYVAFGGEGASMREYTLTYLIDGGVISGIRLRVAAATQAEAEAGLRTAKEIAGRQHGELYAARNDAAVFAEQDMQVMGAPVIGVDVAAVVKRIGEPKQVQTLPGGRLLVYDGAAVELGLNEQTGEEIVLSVSVTGEEIEGPRGLRAGMSVQEATALFACREDLYAAGGVLYLEGEALDEPPCGEVIREDGGVRLRYLCLRENGQTGVLEAGVRAGVVAYWRLAGQERRAADGL